MTTTQNTARVGLFFLLGLALIWVTYETLGDGNALKKRGYNLVAGFDNLKELKAGDDIRMAGVKIGAVESTRLAGRRAEAVLRIDPAVQIAGDATATISSAGLLGTNYISIDLGSPGVAPLAAGAEISTQTSPDLNTIMTQLGELGNKLEGALGSIGDAMGGKEGEPGLLQRINTLLTDNSAKVDATMTNLQEITHKVNQGEGTLGKLINDPSLHDDLLATVGELKVAAGDAPQFHGRGPDAGHPGQVRPRHPWHPDLRRAGRQRHQGRRQQPEGTLRQAGQRRRHLGQADQRRQPVSRGPGHLAQG
jgi:phospholipid/cholesterol/gamma-HCH transport system substrate-binding protein